MARLRALLLFASAPAAFAAPAGNRFVPSDLFHLQIATDPQISPDGSQIVYVRRSGDIMLDKFRPSLWLIDAVTGTERPLLHGGGNDTQPRWSPDGKRIAYLSKVDDGPSQLFVVSVKTGIAVQLTRGPSRPQRFAWSSDGQSIAYTSFVSRSSRFQPELPPKPEGAKWAAPLEVHDQVTFRTDDDGHLKSGFIHIFLIGSEGGEARQLTDGDANEGGALSWTPDGRAIVFSDNREAGWETAGQDSDLYQVSVESGAVRRLTDRKGPDDEPAVSPDGRFVAYTGFDDDERAYHVSQLYLLDRRTGRSRSLTSTLDRAVMTPSWRGDGRAIFISYDDRGARKVAQVDLRGRVTTVMDGLSSQFLDRPYVGGSFTVARTGAVAATTGTSSRPSDISVTERGGARQLTHLNEQLLAGKALASVTKIVATSFDGHEIEAWLTLPPGDPTGRPWPLILEIHGGPRQAYGPYFSFDDQMYAAAGFAVLSANPRGSSSYGDTFANLIHHDYPGRDYDDLMACVDAAIAQGFADPRRLFVTGGSGGGLLAAWTVGNTSRFQAAAIQKPIINMASFALTSDQPAFYSRYWFGSYPWDNPGVFWAKSPLALVGKMSTPALIIIGTEDYRTPSAEAEQLYAALKLKRVPAVLMEIPGANHSGFAGRPSQAAARLNAIIAWFKRFDDRGSSERPH